MPIKQSGESREDRFYHPETQKLPSRVDLRDACSPVEQQKQLSSCTANALAAGIEYIERRDAKKQRRVSRLFIYYNARVIEHVASKDDGVTLRDSIRGLALHGVCTEHEWPYLEGKETVKPTERAYEEAKSHVLEGSFRVHVNPDAMRGCLADGHPIVFGIDLYTCFDGGGDHGHIRTPMKGKDKPDGGHAMVAVGYDDLKREFIVRNSWGAGWGDGGYAFLGYDYLGNESFCYEAWAVTKMRAI
jgi:C1A family cysteine protease